MAVRSSAEEEDSDLLSYAGQFETFLGVEGEEALLRAVEACRASGAGARAASYRGDGAAGRMCVVVQRMLDPEYAMERYEDMPGHVGFPCRAGSAILFHCHGIHTAFPNNSDQPRMGLIYSYGHFWSKNGPSAIPRDLDRLADTPLRRQLFGAALDQEAVKRERLHLPLQVVPKVGSSRAKSMKRYDLSEVR